MKIDDFLERLQASPADVRLGQLEPAVWARIEARVQAAPVWGVRATAIAALLLIGLFTGAQLAPASATETAPFSAHPRLAPSTLLTGDV